jgi:hypothetical protein
MTAINEQTAPWHAERQKSVRGALAALLNQVIPDYTERLKKFGSRLYYLMIGRFAVRCQDNPMTSGNNSIELYVSETIQ